MPIIKKQWHKTTLVIDLRPIQAFNYNGVTISGINWIKSIIKTSKSDQPIILWTNSKKQIKLPNSWTQKQNIQHVHTNHSNAKLLNLWFFNIGQPLSKLLHLQQNYIYFSPDIRLTRHNELCLKKSIYFHDLAFKKLPKTLSLKSRLWFKLNKPKQLYKTFDQIITNSSYTKSELQKTYGKPLNKIQIIHPSIPNKLTTQKITTPNKYYLTISTLQKRKQLQKLINQFQNTHQNLIILGNKDKTFAQTELKSSPNIFFYSNLTNPQKNYLIKNSIATIYPSQYEGFGLPILESIRLNKTCYTPNIEPYKSLFKNQTHNITQLFTTQHPTIPQKTRIHSLKHQSKKLAKLIYKLD
jgi:glycosyltransferase involved in cell wall biosynthesis